MHFLSARTLSLREALTRSPIAEWRDGKDYVWVYPIGGRYQLTYFQPHAHWPYPRMSLEQCEAQLRSMNIPLHGGWVRPNPQQRARVKR
jgi:hypothetical protein